MFLYSVLVLCFIEVFFLVTSFLLILAWKQIANINSQLAELGTLSGFCFFRFVLVFGMFSLKSVTIS